MRLREIGFSSQPSAADLAARTRIPAPTEHVPRSLLTSPPSPNNGADLAGSGSVFARKMSAPGARRSTSWLSGSTRPAECSIRPFRTPGRKLRAALAAPELGVGGTQIAAS
jgi:hypothetical protein